MAKPKDKQRDAHEVTLTIPLADADLAASGYEGQQAEAGAVAITAPDRLHVNIYLGRAGAKALLSVRNGLRLGDARLSDGRPVWTTADALRWMMEQIAYAAA